MARPGLASGLVVAAMVFVGSAGSSRAEPILGTVIDYAPATGVDDGRLGASLYLLRSLGGGAAVGGELAGTLGGHMGGWGCDAGTGDPGDIAPAVAVFCFEPTVQAHAILGRAIGMGSHHQLRLEAGVGVTGWLQLAGQGGAARSQFAASGLVRASWLIQVGHGFGGQWWTGIVVEERDYLAENRPAIGSLGLVLEAIVME